MYKKFNLQEKHLTMALSHSADALLNGFNAECGVVYCIDSKSQSSPSIHQMHYYIHPEQLREPAIHCCSNPCMLEITTPQQIMHLLISKGSRENKGPYTVWAHWAMNCLIGSPWAGPLGIELGPV